MSELLILSGKGGTGKTTLATAFIKMNQTKYYADCDVDAPNLHLLLQKGNEPVCSDFYGMEKSVINQEACVGCGKCFDHCRFEAIDVIEGKYVVNPYACEGCGVCELVCEADAVSMNNDVAGELQLYKEDAIFSTAKLKMGSGTSGKLVSAVKKQLRDSREDKDALTIVDGSPGIGCPVIASISGADYVLIVAEPSLSGMSDMERIIETSKRFKPVILVCVNKFDINVENTSKIEAYCKQQKIKFVGKIPYDAKANQLLNEGLSLIDRETKASKAIKEVYETIKQSLNA